MECAQRRRGLGGVRWATPMSWPLVRSAARRKPMPRRPRPGRRIARGALYTALERLEIKGFVRSRMGEPLPERGGRARRYFTVTAAGLRALRHSRHVLLGLWDGLESKLGAS